MGIKFSDIDLKKAALLNGIGLGLLILVLGIIASYILASSTSMLVFFGIGLIFNICFPIFLAVFFTIDLRKKIGGFWGFKRAVSGIFLMFLVVYLIFISGNLLFTKVIDKDMPKKIQQASMEASLSMVEKFGGSKEQIEDSKQKMEEQLEKTTQITVGQTIKGYLFGILFIFIGALIFAAIFKKTNPNPFANQTSEEFPQRD